MAVKIKVSTNVNAAIKALKKTGVEFEAAADRIMRAASLQGVKDVKNRWPVKTGKSKAGWQLLALGPMRYAFFNPVPYVRWVRKPGSKAGKFANEKGKGSLMWSVRDVEAKNTKRRIVRQLRKLAKDLSNG